jgi:hypothetical protein
MDCRLGSLGRLGGVESIPRVINGLQLLPLADARHPEVGGEKPSVRGDPHVGTAARRHPGISIDIASPAAKIAG